MRSVNRMHVVVGVEIVVGIIKHAMGGRDFLKYDPLDSMFWT